MIVSPCSLFNTNRERVRISFYLLIPVPPPAGFTAGPNGLMAFPLDVILYPESRPGKDIYPHAG
jgi:hypothetical protein